MATAIDLYVDELLDDTVRGWMRARDVDPARDRNECLPLQQPSACARLRSHPPPAGSIARHRLQGRCAEERIVQRMCRRGAAVRNQLRVQPGLGRRSRVLDVSPFPSASPRLAYGIESKYLNARPYLAGGAAGLAQLAMRVRDHVRQVIDQMQRSASPTGLPGLPRRIQLWYQVGGTQSRAQFQPIAGAIGAAVRQANAALPPGQRVIVQIQRVGF